MLNKHHIIPLCRAGEKYEPDNIKLMDIKEHRNLHNLFWIERPHEQISRILTISETAWIPERIEAIDALLRAFKWEYYKESCLRKWDTKFSQSGMPNYWTQSGR
jgi:hypothetical protein